MLKIKIQWNIRKKVFYKIKTALKSYLNIIIVCELYTATSEQLMNKSVLPKQSLRPWNGVACSNNVLEGLITL